ncbi:uncharacterized protein LOC142229685 [Haematobia irritans]|uniref:uncharacterized protein LOC142229685 n=1 Tax=Haematobia irritans TaxID=7368 RepID=UPI003F4F72B6
MTHPSTLTTFVSNRVAEIQEWSDRVDWRHVPGKLNPADIVSRGSNVAELDQSIWFGGPSFLLKDESDWPVNNHFDLTEEQKLLETRKSKILVAIGNQPKNNILEMVQQHSSFDKIMRIMCYVLRFIDSLKKYKIAQSRIPGAKEMK